MIVLYYLTEIPIEFLLYRKRFLAIKLIGIGVSIWVIVSCSCHVEVGVFG